ncbi:MAG: hypothetical protein CM1200mP14_14490 [Gammaproteobacteria bacterium]|nr:MAG: hypothetical protein CM1200mP14_14490 [Gammaproteobacteria bacterium]
MEIQSFFWEGLNEIYRGRKVVNEVGLGPYPR